MLTFTITTVVLLAIKFSSEMNNLLTEEKFNEDWNFISVLLEVGSLHTVLLSTASKKKKKKKLKTIAFALEKWDIL